MEKLMLCHKRPQGDARATQEAAVGMLGKYGGRAFSVFAGNAKQGKGTS